MKRNKQGTSPVAFPVAAEAAMTPTVGRKAHVQRRPVQQLAREGSKKAAVLALLRRPKGATLEELMEATAWQAHSVRGFLSGSLRKRMGLSVKSIKNPDGKRTYRVKA